MKPHLKPIRWQDMPMSARKCFIRLQRWNSGVDPFISGFDSFGTLAEPDKSYLRNKSGQWFVANTGWHRLMGEQ